MNFMIEIIEPIQSRRSVRRFSGRKVDRENLMTCLEAARLAPSAENNQPWRFLVLDDAESIQAFGEKAFSGIYRPTQWAMKASAIVVLVAELDIMANTLGRAITKIPYYLLDMGIAGENFVLQAQSMGLGTCWIGWFDVKKAQKHLNIPQKFRICDLIAVGYPHKDLKLGEHKRKPLGDVVRFNAW